VGRLWKVALGGNPVDGAFDGVGVVLQGQSGYDGVQIAAQSGGE
jgi:hypothetical protein